MTTRTRQLVVRLGIGMLVVVLALAASTLVISNRYATTQSAELSFTLPDDFAKVRAILVGSEATKQIIIRARDNDFLDEKWTALKPNANGLEMNAKLKVRSRDDYIGRPTVKLKQVVSIKSDEILSDIALEEPSERLWEFEISTHYLRNKEEKTTRVDLRLTQRVVTIAPWFAHRIADNRVLASAERQLVNQKRAIQELIADGGKSVKPDETE